MSEHMHGPVDISSARAAMHRGDLTPLKLVSDCLDQINRLEPLVSAWVSVDAAGALRAAEQLGKEMASGKSRGPLHGIPLGIKDIFDVEGMPTRAGSSLTDARPAGRDATVVARLRAAGAVILGKTVTTEFASFDPPPTRNPWNTACTPGGSSSGSAAALALGMCCGALGSQTGGSITRPASYCGVAGCKPTFGRVSRAGVVPLAFHLDHVGPMARSAADCGVLLSVIAGDDPRDPAIDPCANVVPATRLADAEAPRLGVIRPFFFEEADPEVARLTQDSLQVLTDRGARVVELSLPAGFDEVHKMHRRLMACEAADYHRQQYGAPRSGYGPQIAALLEEGFAMTMAAYQEALRHRVYFAHSLARTLEDVDALVTPATATGAPDRKTTGDPKFNSIWSHAGTPTVSIPCALTQAGLPISLQLISPPWTEQRLLSVAVWCEERLGFQKVPPILAK